jgi:hypothetical protein
VRYTSEPEPEEPGYRVVRRGADPQIKAKKPKGA